MAVIPQYNAANPATPRGPVLERERRARIDNGAALRGLNEVANELSQGGVEIPNIDPETGQAGARAIMSVGDGLRRVGGVIAEIREREAEARDYREVHEARMAMEREAAEFEIWQQTNRDPKTWEEESRRRIESFSTRYFEDRELSPRAERDIRMRME